MTSRAIGRFFFSLQFLLLISIVLCFSRVCRAPYPRPFRLESAALLSTSTALQDPWCSDSDDERTARFFCAGIPGYTCSTLYPSSASSSANSDPLLASKQAARPSVLWSKTPKIVQKHCRLVLQSPRCGRGFLEDYRSLASLVTDTRKDC